MSPVPPDWSRFKLVMSERVWRGSRERSAVHTSPDVSRGTLKAVGYREETPCVITDAEGSWCHLVHDNVLQPSRGWGMLAVPRLCYPSITAQTVQEVCDALKQVWKKMVQKKWFRLQINTHYFFYYLYLTAAGAL